MFQNQRFDWFGCFCSLWFVKDSLTKLILTSVDFETWCRLKIDWTQAMSATLLSQWYIYVNSSFKDLRSSTLCVKKGNIGISTSASVTQILHSHYESQLLTSNEIPLVEVTARASRFRAAAFWCWWVKSGSGTIPSWIAKRNWSYVLCKYLIKM